MRYSKERPLNLKGGLPVTEATAFTVVRGITLGRFVAGLTLLPLAGWLQWWLCAALVFVAAFFTDMVDGPLARYWGVTSNSGARLDSNADAALTFGGLTAVVTGGGWPLVWLPIVLLAWLVALWLESWLSGDLLGLLVLLYPVVNLLLVGALGATMITRATGWPSNGVIAVEAVAALFLFGFKRQRVGDYICQAIDRT